MHNAMHSGSTAAEGALFTSLASGYVRPQAGSFPGHGTVYGVVMNDAVSRARLDAAAAEAPYKGLPMAPVLYIKPANTLRTASDQNLCVSLPRGEQRVEVAATVGVVIGSPAARLSPATALDVVAGYVAVADLSLPHASYYRPAIRAKCFDGACPMGTSMATPGQVGDPARIVVRTFFDDLPVAERSLADLHRDVPTLLADVTEFMTLSPGDVLLVGVEYQSPCAATGTRVRVDAGVVGSLSFAVTAANDNGGRQ